MHTSQNDAGARANRGSASVLSPHALLFVIVYRMFRWFPQSGEQIRLLAAFAAAVIVLVFCPAHALSGQISPKVSASLDAIPDATVLIIPVSGDSARVALAYRGLVAHSRVQQEIISLTANGWGIGNDLAISDYGLRPDMPKSTSARFSLRKAPQVQDNAPALMPYLRALQHWNRVDVIFNLPELKPYNGIEAYECEAYAVRRTPEENAYHYEALIRDHKGKLPEPPPPDRSHAGGAASLPTSAPSGKPSSAMTLAIMLVIVGVGLLGGLGAYNWMARRASGDSSRKNLR